MSVDSKMTAIADKIRGLRGLTGTMGLDAMATNLQAEQTSITNALAALADKGVTVPDGSTSDALAGLIEALETGGGVKIAQGSLTFAEDRSLSNSLEIEHNLGVVPNFYYLYSPDAEIKSGARYGKGFVLFCGDIDDVETYFSVAKVMVSSSVTKWSQSAGGTSEESNGGRLITGNTAGSYTLINMANSSRFYIQGYWYASYGAVLQAGCTYYWTAAEVIL